MAGRLRDNPRTLARYGGAWVALAYSSGSAMTVFAALVPSLPLSVAVGGEPTGLML